jgi:hypothetical protein
MEANVVVAACRLVLDLLSSVCSPSSQRNRLGPTKSRQSKPVAVTRWSFRFVMPWITILCFFLSELLTPLALRQ